MRKAKIYIETTLKGPRPGNGVYGVMAEFTDADGKRYAKDRYGFEENTTYNRSTLKAVLMGLERFDRGTCEIEIVTGNIFIANNIERGRPEDWSRQEWKTLKNEDIRHRDLWQQFLEENERHKITVAFRKINDYSHPMIYKMREMLKEWKKTGENPVNTKWEEVFVDGKAKKNEL